MKNPKLVLISDIHFNINTIELASAALRQAFEISTEYKVPLIIAGDLHDTKASLRAECIDAIIKVIKEFPFEPIYAIVGNHDLLSEKSSGHALGFLDPLINIVSVPEYTEYGMSEPLWLLPYYNTSLELTLDLARIPKGSTIIMHQGVQEAYMGHYVQDKTSLPKEFFADYRVISGHYHRRQDIQCGPAQPGHVGTFSYIGNPFTLSFGEALDPPKGFRVLYDDGSLEFVPTNLRKHVVLEYKLGNTPVIPVINPEDLVWVKIIASKLELSELTRESIAKAIGLPHLNFKLDLIPVAEQEPDEMPSDSTDEEVLDALIDSTSESKAQRANLKKLWRSIL